MANLPTAYASQRFGRKTLDFYAVEGDVIGADPRARADERRLEDMDGARHAVRLMEKGFELDAGQTATVLRMQPGPARRSRPVAVVNHDTGSWCRTHPGAEGLLAKAGVSRTLNWALTMTLFTLAALALIWPFLRAFLVEVDAGLFAASPNFDVAALAVAALPGLSSWSFSEVIAPVTGPLVSAMPALASFADMLVFGGGVTIAALGVYLLRSWRLLWAPLFVAGLGAVSIAYGGVAGMVEPALSGLAIAAVLFVLGGVVNRVRDSARLEARIAVLADHLLRQGPQDAVAPAAHEEPVVEEAEQHTDAETAIAPAAAASAASLREPGEIDGAEAEPVVEPHEATEAEDATEASAEPAPDGEVDAPAEVPDDAAPEDVASEETAAEAEATEAGVDAEAAEAVENPVVNPEQPQTQTVEGGEAEEASAPETGESEVIPETVSELEPDAEITADERKPEPADLSADTTPAGLDPEEAERLRNDPRYASRAIVLPPPPPMPAPSGEGSGEAVGQGETTTLKPSAPLGDNVIPIFAGTIPSVIPAVEGDSAEDAGVEASEERVLEPADGDDTRGPA